MEKLLNDQADYIREVAYTGGFSDDFITKYMDVLLICFARGDSVADAADVVHEHAVAVENDDDGQPTEYEEWQDYYGGDNWDHGQFEDNF